METAERYFLPKSERLFLQKEIDRLFDNGQSFISYPLRIIYLPANEANTSKSGISILVSVPKKRIKRAVKRNRIKRLIRETFRLQKNTLSHECERHKSGLHIAFLYIGNEVLPYAGIAKAMSHALKTIGMQNLAFNETINE